MKETVLGVDVGGSHITAAVVDIEKRSLVPHTVIRRKIDAHAPAAIIMDDWTAALKAAEVAWGYKCSALAVSMPGPFDYEQGISLIKGMNKYEALYGMDIRKLFAERMGLPLDGVRFVNDAEAFLRGEVFGGDARVEGRVLGMTLGTGLGSALFEQGLVKDLNLGSSPFLEGIAEDYISTRGILAYYHLQGGAAVQDVKTLVERMGQDAKAKAAMQQLAVWIADFILTHTPVLKPDLVIIGGNISKAHQLFLPTVSRLLYEANFTGVIKVAEMGEQAAILGAASFFNSL